MSESILTSYLSIRNLRTSLTASKSNVSLTASFADKDCQYTSATFQNLLAEKGIVCNMSSTGCCFDNVVAESFFHNLKTECV